MAFVDRMMPAPVGGGFAMEDYWVWCGSVIRGDDARYQYAARPKRYPFFDGYLHSEIATPSRPRPPALHHGGRGLPPRGEAFGTTA